jgi:nucleoside-diphosphate-sugar epimerase
MHVMILGGAGMLGQKLAQALAADATPPTRLTLADIVAPKKPAAPGMQVSALALNMADPATAPRLIATRPDVIYHLAAVVSGQAEQDFDLGYSVNLDATRALFEAIRATPGYHPRVVFTSSIAVFGAPFPAIIPDDFRPSPRTSYGAQKAMGELLLNDYSRRGIFDGVALRLPTLCVRPGLPNKAASGFFSNILREPLVGLPAVLPVPDTVRHWFASPRAAVGFLRHAAAMDLSPLEAWRVVNLPGLSATVAEEIEALRAAAGNAAVALIRREPDPFIEKIVAGWPSAFDAAQAHALGFRAETSFDQIVAAHLEDELGKSSPKR